MKSFVEIHYSTIVLRKKYNISFTFRKLFDSIFELFFRDTLFLTDSGSFDHR